LEIAHNFSTAAMLVLLILLGALSVQSVQGIAWPNPAIAWWFV
jgi:hypothetical protein